MLWAKYSRYMQQLAEEDSELAAAWRKKARALPPHLHCAHGHDFFVLGEQRLQRHRTQLCSPLLAQHHPRRQKIKEKVDVFSFELLAYRALVNAHAMPYVQGENALPEYFIAADDVSPTQHVDVQAAAQKWIDSPFPNRQRAYRLPL